MVSEEDLPPLVLRDAGAEALRLAVVVSAARGVLSPTDLAALDLALRPADKSWGPWTEDAAEAAALSLLPSLAALSLSRGSGNPPSPPPGASSWRATHRRAHHASRDNRLQVAQLIGARVDDDGELWTWGDGAHGLRGDNAGEFVAIVSGRVDPGADPLPPRCEPRRLRLVDARIVPDFPDGSPFPRRVKVAAVAIGGSHVLACDAEGRAWSWGASARGQLGRASRSVPSLGEFVDPTPGLVEFRGASSSIPWSSGSFGGDRCDRCDDGRAPFVVGVAAGSTHCVAIDVAGRAHAWGGNERGQLGLGVDPRVIPGLSGNFTRVIRPLEVTALSDSGVGVVLAAAARFATVFMDEDGRVFASGDVYAAGKNATRRRKFAGCSRRDAAADADADADDAGAGAPRLVPNLPRMIHVSARHEHALMIDRDGGVYAWGNGERGRTGLGRGRVAKTPTGPLRRGAFELPKKKNGASGASYTPVPVRPRRRRERRSLRTLSPGVSLRPHHAFNHRPRRLSTPLLTPFNATPTSPCMGRPSQWRP